MKDDLPSLFDTVDEEPQDGAVTQRGVRAPIRFDEPLQVPKPTARPYQSEALAAIRDSFLTGVWSQVMVLPTGGGKTFVFSQLPNALDDYLAAFPPENRKVLVLAHRNELIEQAAAEFRLWNPDLRVSIEAANQRADPNADIIVASVQTLAAGDFARLEMLDPEQIRIVVVDEAHHTPADTYKRILDYFSLLPPSALLPKNEETNHTAARAAFQAWWRDNNPNRLLLGVTATPARGDSIGLEWTYRQVVYEKTMRWMIEQGYLSPPRGYLVETDIVLDGVRTVAGDFSQGQLGKTVNTPGRNQLAVAEWGRLASDRKTIAFCADVQHAKDLSRTFEEFGVPSAFIHGGMSLTERRQVLAAFNAGEIPVLTNCDVLTEGFDQRDIGCVIMARPTKSQSLYVQMIGRGARLSEGKEDFIVLDVVDATKRHSLVTIGDLFGLPARFDLDGDLVVDTVATIERLMAENPALQLSVVTNLTDLERRAREVDLWVVRDSAVVNEYAKLLWIEDAPDRFHIPLPEQAASGGIQTGFTGVDRLELQQTMLGGWRIVLRSADGEQVVGQADMVDEAFSKAERWIEFNRPVAFQMKAKDAPWRNRPASAKQLALLTRLRAPLTPGLTRGEAAALIDNFLARRS